MKGSENPYILLHILDCLNCRIAAVKSNKGEEKQTNKKLLRKLGGGLEKISFGFLPPSPKRKFFMQVGKAGILPIQCSWLNLRIRKRP